MIASPAYPFLCRDTDRHGRLRYRLRRPGCKTVTIKGQFGSEEFAANYRAAVEGMPGEKRGIVVQHGSMAALAQSYLRSADFAARSERTQRARRHLIESYVIGKWGKLPVAGLKQPNVKTIISGLAGKPGVARNVLSVLSILMALAVEQGLRTDNPTVGIKRPKLSKDGWHTWTEAEIAQYEAYHPVGTMARLGFALALHTCQRSADLIRMGKQHVSGGEISVKQQKTGTSLRVPLHPELRAIIDATPSGQLTFLISEKGKPFASANSFGQIMKGWARESGLVGVPVHGLRKACCRRLAEAGCTAPEIMAISGHSRWQSASDMSETLSRNVWPRELWRRSFGERTYDVPLLPTVTLGHYPHWKP